MRLELLQAMREGLVERGPVEHGLVEHGLVELRSTRLDSTSPVTKGDELAERCSAHLSSTPVAKGGQGGSGASAPRNRESGGGVSRNRVRRRYAVLLFLRRLLANPTLTLDVCAPQVVDGLCNPHTCMRYVAMLTANPDILHAPPDVTTMFGEEIWG